MQQQYFTTLDVAPRQRLDCWNQYTETMFPGMTVDSVSNIEAQYRSLSIGDTTICLAKSPKARIRRWMDISCDRQYHRTLFHIQNKGITTTIQNGQHVVAGSNELALCSSDKPYELDLSQNNECLVIDCPDDIAPFDKVFGRTLCASNNLYLSSLINLSLSLLKQDWNERQMVDGEEKALLEIIHNLVKNAIGSGQAEIQSNETRKSLAAQHQRIVDFIESNLQDSSIRTGQIAARLGITSVAIQKSFAHFGTTPTAYIHHRRLQLARQRLCDNTFDGTLTDLAYELGFSDAAHFSRLFKAHFKVNPSKFSSQA